MSEYYNKIKETADFLMGRGVRLDVILVLGSGLSEMAELVEKPIEIEYSEVPNFPEPTVKGHIGKLIFGELFGVKTAVLCGRFHPYEGHTMAVAGLPIASLKLCGAGRLICTNAAGGINRDYEPGDIMLISDHINLMGDNPFVGNYAPELGGEMFTDLSDCYTKELREKVKMAVGEHSSPLQWDAEGGVPYNHPVAFGATPPEEGNDGSFDNQSGKRAAEVVRPYDGTPETASPTTALPRNENLVLREGVYAYRLGPVFETPAEIRALGVMGADAVGMSTIPESMMAAHLGMETVGISLITNKAAGHEGADLNHFSVLEVGRRAGDRMKRVVEIAVKV